jgi:hypothetical protein
MPTTEQARPGLVLPEYGPSGPELIRRRFGPRAPWVVGGVAVLIVLALVALIALTGGGLTSFEHRSAPAFTLLYPAGRVHRVPPRAGELVRLTSRRGKLRIAITARRLTLPRYRGSVAALLPVYADRQIGALAARLPGFRALTDGKERMKDTPAYQLRYRFGAPRRRTLGIDVFAVPKDGDREGVLLRYRQTNPPRGLRGRDKDLLQATRDVVRSFHLGLDGP